MPFYSPNPNSKEERLCIILTFQSRLQKKNWGGVAIAYMKGNILEVNNAFKIHVAVYNWFLVEVLKPAAVCPNISLAG
jgi:hypothetical protein